jgi:hypothetical protein
LRLSSTCKSPSFNQLGVMALDHIHAHPKVGSAIAV